MASSRTNPRCVPQTLDDFSGAVTGLQFGNDAKRLVTSSMDRSLKVFGL